MKSTFLSLGSKDLVKGLIVSIITAVLVVLQQIVEAGGIIAIKENINFIMQIAITTGIGYLIKNLLTNSSDKFASTEKKVEDMSSDIQ